MNKIAPVDDARKLTTENLYRNLYVKLDVEKKEFEQEVGKELYIQRHQLEMQSAADIINIHCLEQLRCCKEKHTLHEYFQVN